MIHVSHSTPMCDNMLSHQRVLLAESRGLCQSACMTAYAVMMCAEAGCVHSGGVCSLVVTKYFKHSCHQRSNTFASMSLRPENKSADTAVCSLQYKHLGVVPGLCHPGFFRAPALVKEPPPAMCQMRCTSCAISMLHREHNIPLQVPRHLTPCMR